MAALISSLCSRAQSNTPPDSVNDIPLYEMLAFFKQLDSLKLPVDQKTFLQYEKIKWFIKNNPRNRYSTQFISWGKYFNTQKIDTLYNLLDSPVQSGVLESIKYQKMRSVLTPGVFFPEMILTDTTNQLLDISSLKGKIVFLNVWASWCVPCRAEIPELIRLYEKYKNKGFIIIGISLDDDKTKWLKAIAKDVQPWNQYCELKTWRNNSMLNKWGITGIPYNFLIDRQGKLNDKEINIDLLEEKIKELL